MLAASYTAPGASSVLTIGEVPTPEPGPGEVRVRLRVAGVNPTDWKSRAGAAVKFAFQVPGQDGVGEIDSVGPGVDEGRIGERVWVYFAAYERQWGTAAQYTVLPSAHAVPLPENGSDEVGASLGIPALTAWHCLFADGPLDGRAVLVAGGAGAVGHAAIELAKLHGATVIATVSGAEKEQLAREAGADVVVNYRAEDAAEQVRSAAPDGVARIVEVALGPNLELDLAAAAKYAVISTYVETEDGVSLPVRRLMVPNLVLRFVLVYTIERDALAAAVVGVGAAVAAGALTPLPVHRFPLEEAAAAHDAVASGAVGKVLIDLP